MAPLVGKGKPISVARLHKKLAAVTSYTGDARAEIYAYLGGKQTVSPDRAFNIGEAFWYCGPRWVSGPTALFAAGLLPEFVGSLAALSVLSDAKYHGDRRATRLLFAAPALCGSLPTTGSAEYESLAHGIAMRAATAAADDPEMLRATYETWRKRSTMRGLPEAFQVAHAIAGSTASFEARVRGMMPLLTEWALNSRATRDDATRLLPFSPAASMTEILPVVLTAQAYLNPQLEKKQKGSTT